MVRASALPAAVYLYHIVGGIKYRPGGTVVLLKLDHFASSKSFEFKYIPDVAPLKL